MLLEEMQQNQESFFEFAQRKSLEHRKYFLARQLNPTLEQEFKIMAAQSLAQQQALENQPQMPFDDFLQAYFQGNLESKKQQDNHRILLPLTKNSVTLLDINYCLILESFRALVS